MATEARTGFPGCPEVEVTIQQLVSILLVRLERDVWTMSNVTLGDLERFLASSSALVRRARNSRCPVNVLPMEILSTVFQYAPIIEYERTGPCHLFDCGVLRPRSVITLAHVCRHWREVALNTPTLWHRISDSCTRTRHMFSQRSASAPLHVSLENSPSHFMTTLISSNSTRFRELHWNNIAVEALKLHATFPVPNLEVLTLRGKMPVGRRPVNGEPLALFGGRGAPRLRVLSLDEIYCMPANQFPLLTSLHINDCFSLTVLDGLVHLLRSSPLLVDICLEDPYEESRWDGELDNSSPPSVRAPLDHARRVVFEGLSASCVNWILARVALNPQAAVRITRYKSWPSILSVKLLDLPMIGDVSKLSINYTTEGDVILMAVGSHTGIRLQMSPGDPQGISLLSLPDLVPTRQIRELWIGGGWTDRVICGPLQLRRLLGELPSLDLLVVHEGCITGNQLTESLTEPSYQCGDAHACSYSRTKALQVILRHATATSVLEMLSAAHLSAMDVRIAYHPRHSDELQDGAGPQQNFKSVTYEHYKVEPRMTLPDLCASAAFEGWPSPAC